MLPPLLLLFLIPNVDSCLRIQYSEPPPCACLSLALDASNLNTVSDNAFYWNVTGYNAVKAPVVQVDDCAVSIYCEGDYSLVVFDKELARDFGSYQINGMCDPFPQTWLLADANGLLTSYSRLYATCVDFKKPKPFTTCTTKNATSLFLAYSNDLNPAIFSDFISVFSDGTPNRNFFNRFARLKFDTQVADVINVYTDFEHFSQSLDSVMPTPTAAFTDPNQGSDVLKAMDKFLDIMECGAKLIVVMKRWPVEQNVDALVWKMRMLHVTPLIFAMDTSPSDGVREMLYNLTSKTNGFCAFDEESNLVKSIQNLQTYHSPMLIYKHNLYNFAGLGSVDIPELKIDLPGVYNIQVSVMTPMPYRHYFSFRCSNGNDRLIYAAIDGKNTTTSENWLVNKANLPMWRFNCEAAREMKTRHSFQIRIYTAYPVYPDWLPFDD